jgi:hypothetical protein
MMTIFSPKSLAILMVILELRNLILPDCKDLISAQRLVKEPELTQIVLKVASLGF